MSFLGRILRHSEPAQNATHALAMVMLEDAASIDIAAIVQELNGASSAVLQGAEWEANEGVATATLPGGALGLAVLPVPIPPGDLEGPVKLAWHWPDAATAVASHTAHVIVHSGSTTLSRVQVRLALTKLVGVVLKHSDAVGVYVGDALLVRSAHDYAADASSASPDALPLLSWIGFQLVREDAGYSVYTTGLTHFGLKELEARRPTRPVEEVLGMLAEVAHYQIATGRIIGDGETVGATAHDRTRVRYQSSAFIPDMTVAVLELT